MNTRFSGSARVDDSKSHPQGEIRGLTKLVKITEHSREGSDWVDDIQGHPRGRVGWTWQTRQDVRKFAAQQRLSESEAVKVGMERKAREFVEAGAEIYAKRS